MCEFFKKRNSIKLKGKEISGDFTARTSIKCAKEVALRSTEIPWKKVFW